MGGYDLQLYDSNLTLVADCSRDTKENSIKFMIQIKSDKLVLATNSDIEFYGLIPFSTNKVKENQLNINNDEISSLKIKELKKYINAHKDSILTLTKLSGNFFLIIEGYPRY